MANLKAFGRTAPALNRSYIYDSAGDGDRTRGSYLSQTLGGRVKSHPANFNSLSINNELEIPQEGELDLYGTRPASAVSVSEVSKSTHKDTDYLADQTSESYSNQKTFSRGHMPTWRKMLLDPELAGEILSRQWPRVSLRASYKRKAPYVAPDEYDTEDEIKKNDKDTGITKRSLVTLTFIIIGIIIVAAAAIPVLLHLQLSESKNVQVNKSLSVNKPYDNSLFGESTTINLLSASIKLSSLDSKISSYMSSSEQTPSESSLVHSTADMHKSNDFSARTTAASSEIAMSKIQSFTTINSLGDISTESYLKQSLETTSKRQSVSTMSNSDAIIKESQSSVIKTVDFSTLLASRVITTSKSQPVTQVSNTDAITNESILVKSSAITDTPNDFFTAKSFPSREITTSNSLLVTSMYNSYSITSDSNFERSSAIMNDDFSSSTITALRDITISNGQSFASIYSSDEIKSEISSASQLPPSKNASSKIRQ